MTTTVESPHFGDEVRGRLLPQPGRYDLRGDRCAVALTRRPLGVPVLHRKLTATDGLVVIDDEHTCELELGKGGVFSGDLVLGPDSPRRTVTLAGSVRVRREERDLRLTGTLHYCDAERLILWVRGRRGRLHVEAAAEFVR